MASEQKSILIINGSLRGTEGNTWALSNMAAHYLQTNLHTAASIFTLTDPKPPIPEVYEMINDHDGLLVMTGVYWSNWSSPLQRFVEVVTAFENSPAFFGKPVACAVTMDSVGGIEVAARIQAVFAGLGCWSPPCSTVVLSRVGQEAITASKGQPDNPNEDVWCKEDVQIVLQNLVTATSFRRDVWKAWPYIELQIPDQPWPEQGPLNMNTPKFL